MKCDILDSLVGQDSLHKVKCWVFFVGLSGASISLHQQRVLLKTLEPKIFIQQPAIFADGKKPPKG